MKFWLIQRGKFKDLKGNIDGLTGRTGLVDLDYMGSSEYEWGAIPYSYRRIMAKFEEYILIKTIHKSKNGLPMWIYGKTGQMKEIQEALKKYLANPYQLKECSGLEPHCQTSGSSYGKANFWWEIENGIDFMFFYGDQKTADKFTETITNAYNNWWLKKGEETRKEELAKALMGY